MLYCGVTFGRVWGGGTSRISLKPTGDSIYHPLHHSYPRRAHSAAEDQDKQISSSARFHTMVSECHDLCPLVTEDITYDRLTITTVNSHLVPNVIECNIRCDTTTVLLSSQFILQVNHALHIHTHTHTHARRRAGRGLQTRGGRRALSNYYQGHVLSRHGPSNGWLSNRCTWPTREPMPNEQRTISGTQEQCQQTKHQLFLET